MLKYSHVQCTVLKYSLSTVKYSHIQCTVLKYSSIIIILYIYIYIFNIYIHIRLMIHNVVMNTQGVYPRKAIESCSRTFNMKH